jgi:CheY-like chemotaxis protein
MFFNTHFTILVVDDEPDVLSLTKMLLRDVEVFGIPIHIETARSKAEAIELLDHYQQASASGVQQMISVAFIDVVMETDHAGLELCDYIRNDLNNYVTQLFIRTGQPGTAPEREVIDKYDINGYFTKTELDETKLYSLLKSGIRQAITVSNAVGVLAAADIIAENAISQQAITQVMDGIIAAIGAGSDEADPLAKVHAVSLVEGDRKMMGTMSEEEARALRDRLVQLPHQPLGDRGDYYVVDGKTLMIYIAPAPTTAENYTMMQGQMEPTRSMVAMQYPYTRMLASMWKRAGNGNAAS